jgi:glutathione S-transferase
MQSALPILYSFRRCPFAMRARLALVASGTRFILREVILRDKPEALRRASPKATVPVLVAMDGTVLDESLDIMLWALERAKAGHWLEEGAAAREDALALIAQNDGPFKRMLDGYKYPGRHGDLDAEEARTGCVATLQDYDTRLAHTGWLNGECASLADLAILPFVRQFAHVDRAWFARLPLPHVQDWLQRFLASPLLETIMARHPAWREGDPPTIFPDVMPAQSIIRLYAGDQGKDIEDEQ